ncbi:hypothetical protein ACFOU2_01350 [Bacillus songklensis]|uniref:Uncharacterized protein n=1 Tax=Bacillus songklensis TaxID=1069116 RepID=A0ABV8AX53_9BACI
MIESILQHKWLFLVLGEMFFSVCIICFLTLRYWFHLNRLSFLFIVLLLLSDGWLFLLGLLDYTQTRSVSLFQIITILFILYALTIEKTRHENPAKSEDSVTGPFSKDQLLSLIRDSWGQPLLSCTK